MVAEINTAEVFVHLVYFIVPALLVFGVTYFLMNSFLQEQRNTRILELKKEQVKLLTPIKIQAYERLTLYMDRISPDNLVIRLTKAGQSANQLRTELIGTIQSEYNHNISQQIYVSDAAWQMIKAVKEQIIGIVEECYQSCNDSDSGADLGKKILTRLMAENYNGTQHAIELLKKEIEIAI